MSCMPATSAEHVNYGKDFRADMGFIHRVDFERNTLRVGRTWRYASGSFLDRIRVALDWDNTHDRAAYVPVTAP